MKNMAKITPGRSDQWCACYDWLWWLKCWTHWWSEHHQLSNGRERVNNRETEKEEKGATPPPFTVCCSITGRAWNSIITGSYIWPAIWHLTTDIDRFWQIVTDRISASIMLWRGGSGDSVIHASRTWEGPTTIPTKYRSEKETKTSCEKFMHGL